MTEGVLTQPAPFLNANFSSNAIAQSERQKSRCYIVLDSPLGKFDLGCSFGAVYILEKCAISIMSLPLDGGAEFEQFVWNGLVRRFQDID